MMRSRELPHKRKNQDQVLTQFNTISLFLTVIAILVMTYLMLKYYGQSWIPYAILLISFGVIGLFGVIFLNRGAFLNYDLKFLHGWKEAIIYIIAIVSLYVVITVIWTIFGALVRFSVSDLDLYFYYGSSAILEEVFFRMLIVSIFNKYNQKYIGAIVSSILFWIAHLSTYGTSVQLALILICSGLAFSIYYIQFKDITITMIAHMLINLTVVGSLLIQV